eukprot:scaffold309949_cov32-Prasinocladus_malaysianus.AAC.1
MKYFWACEATCVGVLVWTKCQLMPRQSPLPSFCRPSRNRRCSSSVHGIPFLRVVFLLLAAGSMFSSDVAAST